ESQLGRKGGYLDALKITATVLSEGPERDTMIVKTKGTAADVDIPYAGSARREGTGRPRVDYQRRRESADRRKGRERRRLESDIVDAKTRIGAADSGHNRCVTAAAGPVAERQADRDGRWRNGKQAERIDHRLCFPGHGTQQSNGTSFHGGTVDDRWRRANGGGHQSPPPHFPFDGMSRTPPSAAGTVHADELPIERAHSPDDLTDASSQRDEVQLEGAHDDPRISRSLSMQPNQVPGVERHDSSTVGVGQ